MSKTNTVLENPRTQSYLRDYLINRGWKVEFGVVGSLNDKMMVRCEKKLGIFLVEMFLRFDEQSRSAASLKEFDLDSDILLLQPEFFLEMHGKGLETAEDRTVTDKVYWVIESGLGFKALFEAYDAMAIDLGYPRLFSKGNDKTS